MIKSIRVISLGMTRKGVKWLKKNIGGTLTSGGSKMKGQGMMKIKLRSLKQLKMKSPMRHKR